MSGPCDDDFGASQGFDLLSLAFGRGAGPGATDLDEFVELQVFFDGAQQAAQDGQALDFMRHKLCEVFGILSEDLSKYLWHRDRLCLEINLENKSNDAKDSAEPHLLGHLRIGDGAEDEWFIVYLMKKLTSALPDVSCRIIDADGEPLLIEAALVVPRWLTPDNAENRVWLRRGQVHVLPRPRPPEPPRLRLSEGLARLRSSPETAAKDKVQAAITARLDGYPKRAVELSKHVARAVLPHQIARAFLAFPQLVAVAIDHLPPPNVAELQRLQGQLHQEDSEVRFDCQGRETVCVGVRFTRCQYARLLGLGCQLPQRFTARHWKQPLDGTVEDAAIKLGAALCAGLEVAYLQNTRSATSALRWPAADVEESALPSANPWSGDTNLTSTTGSVKLLGGTVTGRRAFYQQWQLDEPFRAAFKHVVADENLSSKLDLALKWVDRNDAEDWLEVSAEELDREMMARQAEFDAFDKKASSKQTTNTPAADCEDSRAVTKEMEALGSRISSLLSSPSCLDGIEAKTGSKREVLPNSDDASDDESGGGDDDVLGMEEDFDDDTSDEDCPSDAEDPSADGLREYMRELDEQLEGSLDCGLVSEGTAATGRSGDFQLGSRHVKVHTAEPIQLNAHATEHLLASLCAEHQLAPGPASLLLGEMGLTDKPSGGRKAAPRSREAAPPNESLDAMD